MTAQLSVARAWQVTADEVAAPYPCDSHLAGAKEHACYRGIDIAAPVGVVFRWLCQLRVAPYSYDWIDNLGRRSPRELTPGLEHLENGQRVMTIFRLVDFKAPEHLTVLLERPGAKKLFGEIAVTYRVTPTAAGSRLVAKLTIRYPRTVLGWIAARLLPWGDLVMMRKQFRTLKKLAERPIL